MTTSSARPRLPALFGLALALAFCNAVHAQDATAEAAASAATDAIKSDDAQSDDARSDDTKREAASQDPASDAGAAEGKDHPLVGRYEGARIRAYKQSEFDEASLLQAPVDYQALVDRDALDDRSGAEWLKLEGRHTRIRYEAPAERSSLELYRNYETKLKANGFEQVYACNDNTCLAGTRKDPSQLGDLLDNFDVADNGRHYANHARYGLYKATRPEGIAYVALLAGDSDEGHILPRVLVDVVETKSMDTGKVKTDAPAQPPAQPPVAEPEAPVTQAREPAIQEREPVIQEREPAIKDAEPKIEERAPAVEEPPAPVEESKAAAPGLAEATPPLLEPPAPEAKTASAEEMASAIASTGNISVYGILFDFDKSDIKPESRPQLDQISQLLKDDAALKVAVIGHTDNKGTPAYNLALSQRRAEAVVHTLNRDYGIAGDRLRPQGKGDTEPVASNDSDAGRARNRRVELARR
ncbi:OmpA family protein [Luteimonas aquatica]|uniref:OmpA family protein n=1 Tax=Luteimonas aquatica TaxID=450364 RepID=UPI001F56F08F|nr:OmpA family protein [Luteimonas aquatica]